MGSVAIGDGILRGVELVARERGLTPDAQAEEWIRQSLTRRAGDRALRQRFAHIAAMSSGGEGKIDSLGDLREARNR
jgi:hypothetical protein